MAERPAGTKNADLRAIKGELRSNLKISENNSRFKELSDSTTRWLRAQIRAGKTLPIVKQGRGIADRFPPSVEIDALSLAEAQAARKMSEKHHVEFLYIGDRAISTGLKLKPETKVCDIVAVSEKGNSFHLGEVKASSGKNGAEVDTAIEQLNSTAREILIKKRDAVFATVSVYLPKRADVSGNYVIKGDQLCRYVNDVIEPVKVQGKPVRVVRFP